MTANMTGNTSIMAQALAQHDLHRAFARGLPIALFFAGAAGGAFLAESADGRERFERALLVEAAMLAAFALVARAVGPPWSTGAWVLLAFLLAGALGIQNAALTHPGTRGTHSTHVTGPITDFATDLVRSLRTTAEADDPRPARMRRMALRWVGFFAGAVSGTCLYAVARLMTPLVPAVLIATIALGAPAPRD